MEAIEIRKDSNIVKIAVAQARHESVDSDVAKRANQMIQELAKNPTPHNRYQIAQLVGFAVNEITRQKTNWLDQVADTKRVAFGDKAQFKTRLEGVRAVIQAKGSTTPRSKVANKTVTLETIAVSARPFVNCVELQNNQAAMGELIQDAAYQMELAQYAHIQSTLNAAAATWTAPYYATGTGIVKATFDPMLRHWARVSGGASPIILGDVEMTSQFAELTGFAANATDKQFSNEIINEYNNTGLIGVYLGSKIATLVNPMIDGTDTPVLDTNKLYILPSGVSVDMRPLKVLYEGDVQSHEAEHIDDLTYEVRLDQYFGAGIVYGDRPYMSVYEG